MSRISLQEVGGCALELHIRCEAADLLAAEGGEHCASLCLSLLFPLSLDQLIRIQLTHLYGTVVRRRARTAVLPRLRIVRLRGRRAGGHLRRLGPAGDRGVRTGFAARGKAVATTSSSVSAPATVTEGGQTGSSASSSPSAADNGARFEFRV